MSTKTSTQPTRRTPLSLSGTTSKQQQHQQQHPANSRNENKPTTSNQKTEQTATISSMQKDNKNNNKQQANTEKKTQQQNTKIASNNNSSVSGTIKKPERNDDKKAQNGVGNGNSSNGNSKDKQQNGKEAIVNDITKEKVEKNVAENIDKKEKKKEQEKEKEKEIEVDNGKVIEAVIESVEKKGNENLSKDEEKLEKEQTELEERDNENEKEVATKPERESRSKRSTPSVTSDKKQQQEEKKTVENVVEIMDISTDDEQSTTAKSATKKSDDFQFESPKKQEEIASSQATPNKTSPKSVTPSINRSQRSLTYTASVRTVTTTTTIDNDDDVEMEVPSVENDSCKKYQNLIEKTTHVASSASAASSTKPTATSTPGKFLSFKEIFFSESPKKVQHVENNKLPERSSCPRTFSQISGRRSIRPGNDAYTYSYFQNDAHHRESYRRINTELDVTSNTNTSLNATVGSEIPNNSSFSFFGRGRKRERTPPRVVTQSTVDLDLEISPKSPKRARIDMYGFFSAVASPLTLLRSRFSKTSIQSSTPVKLRASQKLLSVENAEDEEVEVQNVSGISIEEELDSAAAATVADNENTATEEVTIGNEAEEKKECLTTSSSSKHDSVADSVNPDAETVQQTQEFEKKCSTELHELDEKNTNAADSIKNDGAAVVGGTTAVVKNKKCSVM